MSDTITDDFEDLDGADTPIMDPVDQRKQERAQRSAPKSVAGSGSMSEGSEVAALTLFDRIADDVLEKVDRKITAKVNKMTKELKARVEEARPIAIQVGKADAVPIEGVVHENFPTLVATVASGQPVMVVGPAGTGKTHAAEAVAEILGLDFYAQSVGAQTSKSDLIGFMSATGSYIPTAFRLAYEQGGVFLMDEIDAGNSNVLIQMNAALANGYMSFPDKMVHKHPKFRFIASANTFGLGANRQYVGRNQLDAATLDRFVTLEWNIDLKVEDSLAIGHWGPAWKAVVRHVRAYVQEQELRIVVSPRATQRGARLIATGIDFNLVLHMALLSQFDLETKKKLHVESHKLWREECAKLGPEPEPEPEEAEAAFPEEGESVAAAEPAPADDATGPGTPDGDAPAPGAGDGDADTDGEPSDGEPEPAAEAEPAGEGAADEVTEPDSSTEYDGLEEFAKPAVFEDATEEEVTEQTLESLFEAELAKEIDSAAKNVAQIAWSALEQNKQLENSLESLIASRPVTDPISLALIKLHAENKTPLPQGA